MTIASEIITASGNRNRSRDWYRNALMEVLGNYQGPEYDDPGEFGNVSGSVEVGEMYFFGYIATKPERLHHYDQFPIVYVMKATSDGFLGANLHYIPVKLRQSVALSFLNSGGGVSVPNKTIHRYYFSGIQTDIMRVPESEMAEVSILPTAKFVETSSGVDYPDYRVWRAK